MKKGIWTFLQVFAGCVLLAVATNGVLLPHQLVGGGISGVSMLLELLLGWNMSLSYALINIPLFILGYYLLSRRFMKWTIIGFFLFTGLLAATRYVNLPVQSPLAAILLGGVLYGLGNGLIYGAGASTGGTDILAKAVNKKLSFSISSVVMVMNLVIILFSLFYFGLENAVYILTTMFLSTQVTNYVVDGVNHKRMILIISDEKSEEISSEIMKQLIRGVTIIPGVGGYSHKPKNILYCVIGITQVAKLRRIVHEIDPAAFLSVTDTSQVYGNGRGFYRMNDE